MKLGRKFGVTNLNHYEITKYNKDFEIVTDLNELLGIDYSTLRKYYSGERNIPFNVLKKASELFNICLEDISGIRCPICSDEIPSKTYAIDRLGCKTSSRTQKKYALDCPHCGYLATDSIIDFTMPDLVEDYNFNETDAGAYYTKNFREEFGLNWFDVIEMSLESSMFSDSFSQLTLTHKDNQHNCALAHMYGFDNDLLEVSNEVDVSGTNKNGSYRFYANRDEYQAYLLPGATLTKKLSTDDIGVIHYRNEIIVSDYVVEHDECYELTAGYFLDDTGLAEAVVTGVINDITILPEYSEYPEKPEKVNSVEDIIKNARTYYDDINNKELSNPYNSMSASKYWYYIEEIDSFVANKFLAYRDNDINKYKYYTRKDIDKMDGGHARRILAKFFKESSSEDIQDKFNEFLRKHNVKQTKSIQSAVLFVLK